MDIYSGEFNKLLLTDCYASKVRCFSQVHLSIRHGIPS